ncbi:DMT family transporter [Kocuria palustris]|uniref:DMT family transporter n=1 Tax=Kocuria palustris TaxID=71999 RepID=UPI0020436CB7|nr:DMT family transporter [Kocuria palustris]MCM3330729.1 DMT family transporter [Kocuria palustris]
MDDQGTWPVPLSAQDGTDARAFDRQMMDEIRSDPQALQEIGGVKGNVLIVLVPLLAAIAAVVLLLQWMRDGSWVWPAILAVVLIVAGVVWIGRLRAVMGQARQVLGQAATGSVGYGIGIIRELRIGGDAAGVDDDPADHAAEEAPNAAGADEFELSEDEDDDLSSVEVQLTLSVTPGRGKPFTAQLSQRYATVDALRLERGQHGPVRYLLRSPETTAAVDASLSPDAVQRLYRAAAMNG